MGLFGPAEQDDDCPVVGPGAKGGRLPSRNVLSICSLPSWHRTFLGTYLVRAHRAFLVTRLSLVRPSCSVPSSSSLQRDRVS
jgi:hypothetical protein